MIIRKILYHPNFIRKFKKLERHIQIQAVKIEKLFRDNPLHPSIRFHPLKGELKGMWSISVSLNIRIIGRRMENGDIVFLSIGKHDIYQSL